MSVLLYYNNYNNCKNWLIGKDPDAGRDWRKAEKGMTEDEMVGWHHWLNGREFEQALGVGDEQGSLACYSPWGCKESDTTEQLNWTELNDKNYWWVNTIYFLVLFKWKRYTKRVSSWITWCLWAHVVLRSKGEVWDRRPRRAHLVSIIRWTIIREYKLYIAQCKVDCWLLIAE